MEKKRDLMMKKLTEDNDGGERGEHPGGMINNMKSMFKGMKPGFMN
jgi:hypothetical protein